MKVLVTNDDGIQSEWMRELALELQKFYDVYVVAPEVEMSAKSHGITLRRPLKLKKTKIEGLKNDAYSLTGTPADCVRMAVEILYDDIDVVFSGINKGYNAGMDVKYSGTVGACAEANIYDIPAVAVSAEYAEKGDGYKVAAKMAVNLFERYKKLVMNDDKLVLNINVPNRSEEELKGTKICKLGGIVLDTFDVTQKDENVTEIMLKSRAPKEIVLDSDRMYLDEGYITITPIKYSFGDVELLNKFRNVEL